MSWNDEVRKRQADRYICLEIGLDTGTLFLCDRPLLEAERYWIPYILDVSPLMREIDPETNKVSFRDMTFTLKNPVTAGGAGYFSALLENDAVFDGRPAKVSLAFLADGAVFREVLFTGLCAPGELSETGFELTVRAALEERLGLLQRHSSDTAYGSFVPQPVPMNVVLGDCASGSGAPVKCIPLDLTGETKTFLVAQHAVRSIGPVYRLRAGAMSAVSSGLTVSTDAVDDEGRRYARIAIGSGHQAGDEYFAGCSGLMTGGFLAFNGANQYAWVADHPDFDITGDLTIEFMFRMRNDNSYLFNKQDAMNGYFVLIDNRKIALYLNGAHAIMTTAEVPLNCWSRVKITYVAATATIHFYVDGTEIAHGNNASLVNCTRIGTIPTSIVVNSARLTVAAQSTGLGLFAGEIAYIGLWAQASVNADSLAFGSAANRGFWRFGGDLADISGRDHTLTGVNITAADYGTSWTIPQKGAACRNPAESLRELLLSPEGWNLDPDELDHDSFDAAAAFCAEAGYDAEGAWGGIIPEAAGQLENEGRQWDLLADIARNFEHLVVSSRAGRIALKRIPSDESSPETLVHLRQEMGEIEGASLRIRSRPLTLINETRSLYRINQAVEGRFDKYLRGYNAQSQDFYGLVKEAAWTYRFQRQIDPLKTLVAPKIRLHSGKTREITCVTPGLWGLQQHCDIGDIVLLSAAGIFGTLQGRQVLITAVAADLMQGTVNLRGLTLGESIGAVGFSSEETETIAAELGTFVGATQFPLMGDSFTDADANASYGAMNYLRHGHHYSTFYSDNPAYGNINWRTLLRWRLPAAVWSARNIRSVTIQLQILEIPSLLYDLYWLSNRSGWSGGQLFLNNRSSSTTPSWSESSSYNGIWNPPDIGAALGPTFASGCGTRGIVLNAAGVEAFAHAADGIGQGSQSDEVNICLQEMGNGDYTNACIIASPRHTTTAWRPCAVITYLGS